MYGRGTHVCMIGETNKYAYVRVLVASLTILHAGLRVHTPLGTQQHAVSVGTSAGGGPSQRITVNTARTQHSTAEGSTGQHSTTQHNPTQCNETL